MLNPDVLRRVTANYPYWQGLRIVPTGVFLAVFGWTRLVPGWWPDSGATGVGVLLVTVALMFVASRRIERFYDTTFGQARQLPAVQMRFLAGKWLLIVPIVAVSALVDITAAWPFAVSGVAWALAITAFWAFTGRGRPHWLVAAVALAALSAAPATGLVPAGSSTVGLLLAALGATYAVCGTLDHMTLARMFPPVRAGADV